MPVPFRIVTVVAAVLALAFGWNGQTARAAQQPAPGVAAPPLPNAPTPPRPASPAASGAPSANASLPEPSPAATPPTGRRLAAFRVVANRIAFYSNRFIMEADGNVRVTLGDGTRVTGNTFFYDLRLNRFVIAGNVYVFAAASQIRGAAFAEYFDFDRAYFVPILSEPDRWTFSAGNYAHPLWGRAMPGDTFYLPDLSGERVFLYSKKAVVDPKQSIRFAPATINMGLAFVPFPSYFLNYSENPYFAQNSLTGAFADGPLDYAGGEHGLATAHIRYDSVDGVFPALEVHQVSDDHYVVLSANSLTRPLKTYNLQVYDRITPTLQFQGFLQETAFQLGLSRPLSATAYGNFQLTQALPHSFLQLTDLQYYESLLARPDTFTRGPQGNLVYYYFDPSHNFVPDHPDQATLAWIGFRHTVGHLPISFQLRSSYGVVNNDITPLGSAGTVPYHTAYAKTGGINVTTNTFNIIPDKSGHRRDLYLTGTADKQIQWFSQPHHIDTTLESVSLTKVFNPHVTVLTTYTNVNTGDFYGALQDMEYPGNGADYFNAYTGQRVFISGGFRGFGTERSYAQQLVFTPSQILTAVVSMRENDDFPRPIPGTEQLVGDGRGYVNFGFTPYELDLDLRYRFNRVLVVDMSRDYYFNFGGYQRWAPQFSFQIQK
jgi:hypothetical protein